MREILHAELLVGVPAPAEGRGPTEVRGRMELAYEEALREHAPLAVMRIAVDGIESVARVAAGGRFELVLTTVASHLRSLPLRGDLLALREQDQIVAVLAQTDAAATEGFARALQESVRRIAGPRSTVPLGMRLSIGLAYTQFDAALWFQTLLAVASEGVEVAQSSGGGRVVHSELYSFHQRRLERLSPDRPKPALPPPPPKTEFQAYPSPSPAPGAGPRSPVPAPAPGPASPPAAGPGIHALESRVLSLAREWTEEALAKALAETQRVHSGEIEKLERRIQKLSSALEDAQAELVRAQAGADIDPGVASAYRTVQGLRDESGTAAKREMLEKLFEANLELRTLLGRQS